MAPLPQDPNSTLRTIERAVEVEAAHGKPFRSHLGASLIGNQCDRALWLGFRWATMVQHEGRILRLFQRGDREENVFSELLGKIGVTVYQGDDSGQFRISDHGGHFGGSMDGAGLGIPEAPKTWHLLEYKTHNDKSFKKLVKDGVAKAKPEHYVQMQVYMRKGGLTRALYCAVNKNDDTLYFERVKLEPQRADAYIARAGQIIASDRMPVGISTDPAWFECKFCDHQAVCHKNAIPVPNCRTCLHSTPEMDGDGRWTCDHHKCDLTDADQLNGCPDHKYIPDLLQWAEIQDAFENGVSYTSKLNGNAFVNGPDAWTSLEIYVGSAEVVGDAVADSAREMFGPGCSVEVVDATA